MISKFENSSEIYTSKTNPKDSQFICQKNDRKNIGEKNCFRYQLKNNKDKQK